MKRKILFSILGVALVLGGGMCWYMNQTTEQLMMKYMEEKYGKEFVKVEYINSKEDKSDYVDILTVIPKNEVKEGEDISLISNDDRIAHVYYNNNEDTISDDYFGKLIEDDYYKIVDEAVKKKLDDYKLYFSIYNINSFPDEYKNKNQMYGYFENYGYPNACFTVFIPIGDMDEKQADNLIHSVALEFKENELPVTLTAYFVDKTELKSLDENLNLAIGTMNETEEEQPLEITYIVSSEMKVEKREDVKISDNEKGNDGLSLSIK